MAAAISIEEDGIYFHGLLSPPPIYDAPDAVLWDGTIWWIEGWGKRIEDVPAELLRDFSGLHLDSDDRDVKDFVHHWGPLCVAPCERPDPMNPQSINIGDGTSLSANHFGEETRVYRERSREVYCLIRAAQILHNAGLEGGELAAQLAQANALLATWDQSRRSTRSDEENGRFEGLMEYPTLDAARGAISGIVSKMMEEGGLRLKLATDWNRVKNAQWEATSVLPRFILTLDITGDRNFHRTWTAISVLTAAAIAQPSSAWQCEICGRLYFPKARQGRRRICDYDTGRRASCKKIAKSQRQSRWRKSNRKAIGKTELA